MATPPSSRLQSMLQSAVQSIKWSYSLFWQICPQQGILIWGDGYYNGPIKTRKTVQPMEVSAEEASLQRSQQLRELYESLSAGETNQPARRPCAALSPEDLTETEWFYLMCVSFSFPPGAGLPGKAYARRQHAWLTGANEVDSKTFSRAILAKSARIQTVVCIPLLDGVVEFGTTERVQEDISLVNHVKTFFVDHHPPHPPKPALSEHSTSNPAATSSGHHRFHSPPVPSYAPADPPAAANQGDEEEEDDDDDDDEGESDSEAETGRQGAAAAAQNPHGAGPANNAEPSEFEMSEDIRLGSPDDGSNNLDSDFPMLTINSTAADHQRQVDSFRAETTRRWQMMQDPARSGLQTPPSVPPALDELSQEDTHYSQTVSTILQNQPRWADSTSYVSYSTQSAFSKWTSRSDHLLHVPAEGTSQWLLKYILFTIPFLHTKYRDENSPKSRDGDSSSRFRKGNPQDELSANHVLAERRRREKLNERFIILRSLVPFVTKMDKASILGDTIEYVKQLRKKIQDLEARNRQMEADHRKRASLLARDCWKRRTFISLNLSLSLAPSLSLAQSIPQISSMAFADGSSSRQSLIPSFLYASSASSRSLYLEKMLASSGPRSAAPTAAAASPVAAAAADRSGFLIPAPQEPSKKIAMYSPEFYAACTFGGILSCGLTHMSVTPLDLVKCNMQIDPAKYKSISSGFGILLKEQGVRGFFRGWVPTLLGYSAQGACKFGFYEFFKKYYSDIAGPEFSAKYKTLIYLAGSASAEVIADVALCPFEAVKVRVQTQPGFARGLSDGLPKFVKSEGALGLYKGIVPLWGRQIPYTMMKFASFETIVEMIYKYAMPQPKDQCSKGLQLGVSFAGGYVAGVFCAIVSHPADNLVSFLNNAKGATVGDAVKKLGLWGLFTRGLPLRIVMIGTLTGAQWGIYDAFKVFVGLPTTGGVTPAPAPTTELAKV